ncbi:YggT family protein [Sporolactobacillus putidus]|uniref:YggT family protein n=1 Tax=Sporolactobacillus putidus TaxID=492735 RepID=A0A917S2H1_9BACL|nr:YggT family protein [Sporolactobacillus putidus]GGL53094.1 hypothetical protein GCM10007968_16390 [Sporolactobacillus putidus]
MVKGKNAGMLPKLVSILLTFVQVIIALEILLQFFGANETPFVRLLNGLSQPILQPFQGIFHPVVFSGHTLDLSAVFALIVYSVVGFGIQKVLGLLRLK